MPDPLLKLGPDPISEGPDQYIIEWRRPGLTWSLWNSFLGRHGPHLRSTPAAPSDRKFLPAWVKRLQAGLRPEVWLPSTITNKMVWDGFDPANQEQGRIYDQLPRGWRRSEGTEVLGLWVAPEVALLVLQLMTALDGGRLHRWPCLYLSAYIWCF